MNEEYIHRRNNMPGPAAIFLYDDVNDLLIPLGFVRDETVAKAVSGVRQREIHNNRSVGIDSLITNEDYTLSGVLMERLNPDHQILLYKNCGTPSITAKSIKTVSYKSKFFRGEAKKLPHADGFFGTAALPAPLTPAGADIGAGGTIPADDYKFVVTANYGATESAYAETAQVTVGANHKVALTWSAPATAVPDSYNVYVYTPPGPRSGADMLFQAIVTTSVVISSLTRIGAYPGDATGSFTVTNGIVGSNLATYTAGDDFEIDDDCCVFTLVDDGDIPDGQDIVITYSYKVSAYSTVSYGPGRINPKKGHIVLYQFKPEPDDVDPGYLRGRESHFYNVHMESGWTDNWDAMDWDQGHAFAWDCDLDSGTLKYGDSYTYNKFLETWTLDTLMVQG